MARPNVTRDRLIQAAIDLIESSSFGAVSVDQICERAQVHKGSFYHYFPSKVDLAIEAFEVAWAAEAKPIFERHFAPGVPPLDRLTGLLTELHRSEVEAFEKTGHVRGCPFCTVGSEMANVDQRLRVKADELIERDLSHIERALRDAHAEGSIPATDFHAKTRAIAALVLGTKLQAKLRNDPSVLAGLATQVLEFVGARAFDVDSRASRSTKGAKATRATESAAKSATKASTTKARATRPAAARTVAGKSGASNRKPRKATTRR